MPDFYVAAQESLMAIKHARAGCLTCRGGKLRWCPHCGDHIPVDRFSADPRRPSGYESYCVQHRNAYARQRYQKDPDKYNAAVKQVLYGITCEQYDALYNAQGGVCAICGHPETVRKRGSDETKQLSIDHDHETGMIRGLLCGRCNTLIGLSNDSIHWLQAAVIYLARNMRAGDVDYTHKTRVRQRQK